MKVFFLIGLFVLSGIFGTAFAQSDFNPTDITKLCHPACFEFVPNHASQDNHQVIDFTHNQDFTVIMADGSCNFNGKWNQVTNTCTAHSIILTPADFKTWQTDIASMYVGTIYSTDLPENINYCSLAEWSWQHQTATFQAKYDIYNVIPPTCFTSTPEFPIGFAVLGLIFSLVVVLGRMVDGHWIWQ